MAAIGNVCVQWSLVEHMLLSLIALVEMMPLPKVYRIFGGLDMIPRCNMAIGLMRDEKTPQYIMKRILAVRTELQNGLDKRRNQAIHGVHSFLDTDSVELTMPRWNPPAQKQVVTYGDLFDLGVSLHHLSDEICAIRDEFFEWKQRVGQNHLDKLEREIAEARTPIIFKVAKRIKNRAMDFWGNRKT